MNKYRNIIIGILGVVVVLVAIIVVINNFYNHFYPQPHFEIETQPETTRCYHEPIEDFDDIPCVEEEFDYRYWNQELGVRKDDVIPDKNTAISVAKAIFDGMDKADYEERCSPTGVIFDTEKEVWMVYFSENTDPDADHWHHGGLLIALQKSDGKVLRICWEE